MKWARLSLSMILGLLIMLLACLLISGPMDARAVAQTPLYPAAQGPYPGPDSHPIPGRIEAEDYDVGGEGVAYHDTTVGNEGGEYRSDDVDIQTTADGGGGYNVGWIEEGEWLAYTVDVASAGPYDIQARVASAMYRTVSDTLPAVGTVSWTVPLTRAMHIEFDGSDVSGPMTFVATGDWQNWTSLFARRVPLTEGQHVMRIAMDSGGLNLNWISFAMSRPSGEPPEETIDALIAQMTVTEKIGQLHGIDWMDTADNTRLGIPGFRMADGPHGMRDGKSTSFPVGIAMAATWDPELLESVGIAMGNEFRGRGRNQVLGSCLDITRDPRNGRGPESGGEEPYLSGKLGAALARGIQSTQAIATAKHFAATHRQQGRRDGDHKIDARTLREFYGLPFRMAVQQGGARSVMNAYNWINGRPSSANDELLTRMLREEWGYPFYVVSDWGSIYTGAAEAINAGCDLEMPHIPGTYPAELPGAIARGEVTIDTLNSAVWRVLRTKLAAGLLDDNSTGDPSTVCSPAHRDLALEVARKSIVLLKNEGGILPLNADDLESIALIGPSANVARLDGCGSSVVTPCYAVTPRQGIEQRAPGVAIHYAKGCDINSDDRSGFPAAIQAASHSDVVVFVGGLDDTQEGEELDRVGGSVQLPGQQQALINELAAVNPNVIVVLESGGIVALEQCFDSIQGLLYAFYPGQEGGNAIADILFGHVNPSGKLPVTMPCGDGQLPTRMDLDFSGDLVDGFGYRRFDRLGLTPQYAFGYGLSYTTFEYGSLMVTPTVTCGEAPVLVSVAVTNTGEITGDEVIQLYLSTESSDPKARAAIPMPVKQLRGFQQVALAPGQSESITFALGPEELSFWSISDDSFRVEAGEYTVRVGGSSDALPVSGSFELTASMLYDSATGERSPAPLPVLGNVALHRPVTCSSIEGLDYACSQAVDGDLATRWSSRFSDPQWITVDLGVRQRIERAILRWETAYGRAYRIQVSDDAVYWTDVYSTTVGDGQVDNVDLSCRGRYVRVYGRQRATDWGYSLWELEVYASSEKLYLPLVVRRSSLGPPISTRRSLRIFVDDFEPQPYKGESDYHLNRLGGDRGVVNDSILDLGNGQVTTTISAGNSWGGLWTSLNHPIREGLPIDFSAILPPQILPGYQSQITGLTAVIADGTPGRTFKLELKHRGELHWKKEVTLNGGPQIVSSDLPALGDLNELLWVLDDASAGDYVVLESVSLTGTTRITDTATAAFVWSYGMLLNNWNPATGLVRDKGREASGVFDGIQSTGSLAAATAAAEQLGVITQRDAIRIVDRISDTLLVDLPRFHGLWPHWVEVSDSDGITIALNTEWSSVDTVIAATGLLAAQSGLGMDTSGTERMLQTIDWDDLATSDGRISHGYRYTGDPITYTWDLFGGESWLVALAYASATGQVATMTYPAPPTANGSGFIDELAWLFVPPPSGQDVWGADWPSYRVEAADRQIPYYPTYYPQSCFARLGLFGLSAAEVPALSTVPRGSTYQAFGVGGRFTSPNDGIDLLGAPVAVPHYSAMIASLRPQEAVAMWDWLLNAGPFAPLNNVECMLFPTDSDCDPADLVWNQLRGSWNLSLQTLGWGRYLAQRNGQAPILWEATTTNPLLSSGYRLLVPSDAITIDDSGIQPREAGIVTNWARPVH